MKSSAFAICLFVSSMIAGSACASSASSASQFTQSATRMVNPSQITEINQGVHLSLLGDGKGNYLYQPWAQPLEAVRVHQEVCRKYGRTAAMDIAVTLSPNTDFVFPCESPAPKKVTPSFDQSCYANATMSGPSAVIQGVQDIFEGEALLEKDNRPGSTTGSLAVSVGGMCATTIHGELIGPAGASRNLFLPIGCTMPSIGLFNSAAIASVCEVSDVSNHSFTVIPN